MTNTFTEVGGARAVRRIYLDNAATTRPAAEVRAAMAPFLDEAFGNPAALHAHGREAARAVRLGRAALADLLGAEPAGIVFTSGGTESANQALLGAVLGGARRHLVCTAVEHHAVLETCLALAAMGIGAETTVLPVDGAGRVDPADLRVAMRDDTAVVAVMLANNEIGTLQPVAELAAIAHARGALFFADAVQAVGKVPVRVNDLGVDMLGLSAHKFRGPKGVGALYLRPGVRLPPLLRGGGQEDGRRSGTSNVPGIAGLGAAAALARHHLEGDGPDRLRALVERLWVGIRAAVPGVRRNSPVDGCVPGILNVAVEGAEGEPLLMFLDMAGISASTGSACAAGGTEPSHVLRAIGVPPELAHGSIRFSLGPDTTGAEIDTVIGLFPGVVAKVRALGPARRT